MGTMDDGLAALIAGARRGDAACFEGLVDRYADRLYGYFFRLGGSRSDAEDLLQEVFLRLVSAIGRYEHQDHFDAFLFRIATNLYRDHVRRTRRSGCDLRLVGDALELEENVRAPGRTGVPQPSRRLEESERRDRMQEAMASLPAHERQVIALRHFSDMSFKQIAAIMGTPLGTALARAHRGLARLRLILTETGDERS